MVNRKIVFYVFFVLSLIPVAKVYAAEMMTRSDLILAIADEWGEKEQALNFVGGDCVDPVISYAHEKGLLNPNKCQKSSALMKRVAIFNLSIKGMKITDLNFFNTQRNSIPVDTIIVLKPYGLSKSAYRYALAQDALIGVSGYLIDDVLYAKETVSVSEGLQIVNALFSRHNEQSDMWLPKPGITWQWQLQGEIDTTVVADAFDIDLFDTDQAVIDELHNQGKKVICYMSAGSWENWRADAASFPDSVKGRANGWPGEAWLDVRALDVLLPIMSARFDLAVSKNCDAIEPDNIDGYTNRSGFPLSYNDQLVYNMALAEMAHERGLSIALKNDLSQIVDLVDHFDFAVNEQCFYYQECDMLLPFIQSEKAVLGVEYELNTEEFCGTANVMGFSFMKKDYDLFAPAETCW